MKKKKLIRFRFLYTLKSRLTSQLLPFLSISLSRFPLHHCHTLTFSHSHILTFSHSHILTLSPSPRRPHCPPPSLIKFFCGQVVKLVWRLNLLLESDTCGKRRVIPCHKYGPCDPRDSLFLISHTQTPNHTHTPTPTPKHTLQSPTPTLQPPTCPPRNTLSYLFPPSLFQPPKPPFLQPSTPQQIRPPNPPTHQLTTPRYNHPTNQPTNPTGAGGDAAEVRQGSDHRGVDLAEGEQDEETCDKTKLEQSWYQGPSHSLVGDHTGMELHERCSKTGLGSRAASHKHLNNIGASFEEQHMWTAEEQSTRQTYQ